MAVNLHPPENLLPIPGVELGTAAAGIRYQGRDDLLLMRFSEATVGAAVFTQNAFVAAPVVISRDRFAANPNVGAVLVNSGNANAGTGQPGYQAALGSGLAIAESLAINSEQVWLASTGVIGECLPLEPVKNAMSEVIADLQADHWARAAQAIMTTDSVAKGMSLSVEIDGVEVTVTGIAKGAGMIRPDMATMLAFVATDAPVGAATLQRMIQRVNADSFSCISVDGDTSTNDSFFLFATGQASIAELQDDSPQLAVLEAAVYKVCQHLALSIVRDGEGASHVVDIQVEAAASVDEARMVADTIAHSPLVKTAIFASDPNWGRILAAVGRSGIPQLEVSQVELWLDDVRVLINGAVDPAYQEAMGQAVVNRDEYAIRVVLGRGDSQAHVWTCDMGHEYVRINADYRS